MVRRKKRRRSRRSYSRRRRRARNSWAGSPRRHRAAARKGWRKRARKCARRRKTRCRRTRARNTGFSYNPRRRRRTRRRRSSSRRRTRRRNPGAGTALSLRKPLKAITAGYNVKTLSEAGVVVGGALGNAWLSGAVGSFLPGMLQSGIGSYATGLATAGILGAGVSMIAPRQAGKVFFGGVLEVVTRAVKEYVVPMIPGMSGMGDYLTRGNAAEARNLHGIGDYLTRGNAAEARNLHGLGDYYGDYHVREELAGY